MTMLFASRLRGRAYDPHRLSSRAHAVRDEVGTGFIALVLAVVAVISVVAGSFVGASAYIGQACALAPDAPGKAYTHAVLRCELPFWWSPRPAR